MINITDGTPSVRLLTISRGRQAAVREDFIIRGFGKRAVRVVLMANYNTLELTSKKMTDVELNHLLFVLAEIISKRGWKTGVVDISFLNGPLKTVQVNLVNPAGYLIRLGDFGNLVQIPSLFNV